VAVFVRAGAADAGGGAKPVARVGRALRLSSWRWEWHPERVGYFEFQYTPGRLIFDDIFVDLQPLMKDLELARIDFNIRRGGVHSQAHERHSA
jgi:hypothetical protein